MIDHEAVRAILEINTQSLEGFIENVYLPEVLKNNSSKARIPVKDFQMYFNLNMYNGFVHLMKLRGFKVSVDKSENGIPSSSSHISIEFLKTDIIKRDLVKDLK